MKKIVINGANGYVASYFIKKLLLQDFEVIALVRKSNKFSESERILNKLNKIGFPDGTKLNNLTVFNYSLLDQDFNLTSSQLEDIFDGDISFFHFAANLKFAAKDKDDIFSTNLDGVTNALEIFKKYASKQSRYFLISTAYSCGNVNDVFKEEFYPNDSITNFRNYYEQSKRFAENIVRKHIDEMYVNAHIVRLSQVIGESDSGITHTDYGIFDFIKRLNSFCRKFPNESVRISIDPDASQNLIPIDQVIHYLMAITNKKHLPVIMHIVSRNSIKNMDICNSICDLMPIKIIPDKNLSRDKMTMKEKIIAAGMAFTGSYSKTNLSFSTESLTELDRNSIDELDINSINRMIQFFLEVTLIQNKQHAYI